MITAPEAPFALPVKIDLYEEYLDQIKADPEKNKAANSVDENFF